MKLTSREQEIAEVLFREPLISQDELAVRFGISRSSVAVHISNLMKKGIILGKGYVFNQKASLVVIGELLLDIQVKQFEDQQRIDTRFGGFAIDVSQSLAAFGMKPKLLTVLGNDELGNRIMDELKEKDIDLTNVVKESKYRTPRKIYINEVLQYAEIIPEEQFINAIESREWVLMNCNWLLVEPRYQEFLANKVPAKEERVPNLCACHYIIDEVPAFLNQYSLVVLGVDNFQRLEDYSQLGVKLVQGGTQTCIITDGSSMILYINEQGSSDFTLPPNQSFHCNKDLPLFLAGLVYGLSSGYAIRQAIRIAIGNACSQELVNKK